MGEQTGIEWCHHTFNPWLGCVKVSEGCQHCYAETQHKRMPFGRLWGPGSARHVTSDSYWRQPLKWQEAAQKAGERRRVFCGSMCDVFEDHPVAWEQRNALWRLVLATPGLDWLLLTKRPENMVRMTPPKWREGWPAHVWAMTTVENQARAEERIPHLLRVPARVLGLSVEPMLGPVDLAHIGLRREPGTDREHWTDALAGCAFACDGHAEVDVALPRAIGWVICGGESGHHARPMNPPWVQDLLAQCHAAEVPFFFKQWGGPPANKRGHDEARLYGALWKGVPA